MEKRIILKGGRSRSKTWPHTLGYGNCMLPFSRYRKDRIVTFNKSFIHSKNVVLKGKLFPWTNKILTDNDIPVLNYPVLTKKNIFPLILKQNFSVVCHLKTRLRG